MVRPDLQKWSVSAQMLAELSITAAHPRTRERLLALLLLSQGPPHRCAFQLCKTLGRDVHTVLQWVHDFNARGLAALEYRHTGGTPPRRHALAPLLGEVLEQARIDAARPVSKKLVRPC
jgi:hypothetical protein